MSAHPIDLRFLDHEGGICAYLIDDGGDLALVDPGPATTLAALRAALAERGLAVADLRHLLITHVHLDHAGVAGWLAGENPKLVVHVHRDGAPHLADPEKLVASTRRTFGARHDELWGVTRPVPAAAIRPWEPGARRVPGLARVRALATPGHIGHHLAYLRESDGTLLAGDALGIVLAPGAPTHPATPPPAVDAAAWRTTLAEVRAIGPERAGLAHFGVHGEVAARAWELEEALARLEARVRRALERGRAEADAAEFDHEAREAAATVLPRERVDRLFDVFSAVTDWKGMERWVRTGTRAEAGEGEG